MAVDWIPAGAWAFEVKTLTKQSTVYTPFSPGVLVLLPAPDGHRRGDGDDGCPGGVSAPDFSRGFGRACLVH
ncbi:hypothetical protein [Rhodococcus triatomae]|nr:hypothetical protein G419_12871 [Rhodococcus triatomae BKS 15-14]